MRECKSRSTLDNYAVKIFRSEDEEMFIHAEREFKILQKLKDHPNIVQGVEYIPDLQRSRGFIVMEKINGKSVLTTVLEEEKPLSEEDAKVLIIQVIEGVKHMHSHGVIHRDLNPTNIFLLDNNRKVKIIDFNVSKFYENILGE